MRICSGFKGRYFLMGVAALLLYFSLPSRPQARPVYAASKEEAQARRRAPQAAALPHVDYAVHDRGNMVLAIANNGTFGTYGQDLPDPVVGGAIPSCIFPKNSGLVYLWVGAFWIGAIVGHDTLVSVGTEDFYQTTEFWPEVPFGANTPYGNFHFGSIDKESRYYDPSALSEQDIYCEYTDTNRNLALTGEDPTDNRPHIPLGIKVHQRSMAWSYSYASDFILFDYEIENIGDKTLKSVYMGIWVDGDVWHESRRGPDGWNDDITGFYPQHLFPDACGKPEDVNIAYHADNDGDPVGNQWDYRSTRSAVGVRVIRTPSDSLNYSYNWWIINYSDATKDFGPRRRPTANDPWRDFGGRLGTPLGDRNKYYILSHPEFDYDLYFTDVDHSDSGWMPPPQFAADYARGWDTRYLLSFGPFTLSPGERLPLSFAWVGGENFHQNPTDFANLFKPTAPDAFYKSLKFDNLATNSRWAYWVYDNPGVDTDSDGYAGKFCLKSIDSSLDRIDTVIRGQDTLLDSVYKTFADTFWYAGDGVPDFRGAGPPPAPYIKILPDVGKLTVHWNGYRSENTPDIFLHKVDFEGYRVYCGLDNRKESFSLLASYDREDYDRYVWKKNSSGELGWVLEDIPFTLDSLRTIYADPQFDPLKYTKLNPQTYHDSLFYYTSQDFNASRLDDLRGIHKAYPGARKPPRDTAEWTDADVTYEHGARLPKYYEYEYVIDKILPTIPYYLAVTAFDFGSPRAGLAALETDPLNNYVREYAMVSADTVEQDHLNAYVYPNPYREDGGYAAASFENRLGLQAESRMRRIHFANLPNVCTISILTLDGDLVRRIVHNYPNGGPGAMHEEWDLITRNTQEAVSGLYYWVVEAKDRTQIGKLVIIR